ncbi:MAG: 2-phosphosulfolactate phosphatase [Rickettsiaceae bacterium]
MKQNKNPKVSVIIDVFRAFTTACYVLEQNPKKYIYATKTGVLRECALGYTNTLFIGKNEIGANIKYDIPNSPTRVKEIMVSDKVVLHRTEAGAKGILSAKDADIILATSFVNASATVRYIKKLQNPKIKIIPMGHEATTPSIEDDICAEYIKSLLNNKNFDINPFIQELKEGPGKYFFLKDQWQYPREDFQYCLEIDKFDFAIQAELCRDHALLIRC